VATLIRFIFTAKLMSDMHRAEGQHQEFATLKPSYFTRVAIPTFVDRPTPSLAAADSSAWATTCTPSDLRHLQIGKT
jgi:hypothetical protein